MDGEDGPNAGDRETEGPAADGPLVALYRKYIGEPEERQDVYVGFGTFFTGIALGAVGLALFLYSGTQPVGSDPFWQLREVALVAALFGLPVTVVSIPVLLSVGRRTLAASLLGAGVCAFATVWLAQVYPYQWTDAGNDTLIIGTYAVGLVFLSASTGSALVAQYVERAVPTESGGATESGSDRDDETESVSDEEVREDIEEVMSDSTLTWGGVEQSPTTKRLNIDMPDTDVDIDRSSAESVTETRSGSTDVDDAVSGLRNLQGGEQNTARAESPDEQVDALTEFRRQKGEEDELETAVETDEGTLARLRKRLFG